MESKIVTKMRKIFIIIFLLTSNIILSQNKNYYTLEKNGIKYPKIIRYILLDKGEKVIIDSKYTIFNIDSHRFKYIKTIHEIDTCSYLALNNIKTISTYQLIEDEYKEHIKRTKGYGLYPFPLNHYNSKVFIIEKTSSKKIIKYEVDWISSIK